MRKDADSLTLSLTTRYMRGCSDSHLHLTLHVSRFDNATDLSLMLDLELGSQVSLGHGDLAGLRSYGCGPLTRVGSGFDVFGLPWLAERSTRCSRYVISCLPSPEVGEVSKWSETGR